MHVRICWRVMLWFFVLLIMAPALSQSAEVIEPKSPQPPLVKGEQQIPPSPPSKGEHLPEGLYIWPYLQNVTQHSIVVMWETTEPVIGVVDYGEVEPAAGWLSEKTDHTVAELSPVKIHEIEITGLEPGRKYHYRARYGDVKLTPSTFKTAPPDGTESFRLVAYGDSRSNPDIHRRIAEQIAAAEPDLIVNTADLVSSGVYYDQWKPQFFMPLRVASDHIPVYTCLGNHEANSKHYFNYMSLPGNEVYYSFDYANAHFIALDSDAGYTPYDENSPQTRWLLEDLEAHWDANKWLVVYFHHPLFRAHPTRTIEPQRYIWQTIFDVYGVDLVLNGHDHYYARTYTIGSVGTVPRKGVRHIITGGGGASLYDIVTGRNYIVTAKKVHNLVIMDFRGDKLNVTVKDIDGNIIDSFAMDRTQTPPPEEYVSYEIFEIERDLREGISNLEPAIIESYDQKIEINATLTARANFGVRVEGEMMWTLPGEGGLIPVSESNTKWRFDQPVMEFAVNPGAELRIPIKATIPTASYPGIYPLPSLTIYFKKIVGRVPSGFRNRELTIHPLKVLPRIPVTVPRVDAKISVDGKASEQGWFSATKLSDFVAENADSVPKSVLLARLAHDGTNLYVAAEIACRGVWPYAPTTVARDDRNIIRNEHFRVHLSDGSTVYTFAVNPHGTQADARDSDVGWNMDWLARIEKTDTGWSVEMSIPISAFGTDAHKKQWFINIVRRDSVNGEEAMLAPTFDITNRENRLPEYGSSIKNPKWLPVLQIF